MTETDVLEAIAYAAASWRMEIPQTAEFVWTVQLADLDVDSVRRAIDDIAAVSDYPPTPQLVRARALELAAEVPGFEEAWAELLENASTCDWHDARPPRTMSLPAQALAHSLGWLQFRETELTTYYVHEARQRFAEITQRANRRMREGLPAFVSTDPLELPEEASDLVEGIGEPVQEFIPPPADIAKNVDPALRARLMAMRAPRGREDWSPERVQAAKDAARERLNAAIGEEIEAQEKARAESERKQAARRIEEVSEPTGL